MKSMGRTRLHVIWSNMKQRCNNKNNKSYKNYGQRGIAVCEEWNEFEKFKEWALTNGYSDNLTIDRVDNNGNYEPDNCRWVTSQQQQNNKRTNRYVEIDGETHTVSEWCKLLGNVTYSVVYKRMKYGGWDIEKALLAKNQKRKPYNKDRTEAKYNAKRKPLIAFNEYETIEFASSKDAERKGFCRGAIRKARLKGIKHHGYYWKFKEAET